ncbi:Gfo/Idh/MocA family oxidoreductase [Candidatus Aerophobetes bacterium]|nr:Gfo/Idh/MocA family oxidoreductase [Candidatus Aerophobetes bacterium]
MAKIGLGVIGCGRIAQAHLEGINCLKDEAVLVGVADIDKEKAKKAKENFGAKIFYTDYRELLKNQEVEAVIITLPHHLHCQSTIEAARAGKHILVEKPMALNLKEADKMIEEAEKNGVILMVGQSRRFSDPVLEAYKRVEEIGEIFRIVINFLVYFPEPPTPWWKSYREAGGLIVPLQGSHSIDFVLWFLKQLPESVYATGFSKNPSWEGEDEADIIMNFTGMKVASIHLSLNISPPIHEIIVAGTKGTMRIYEYPTGKPFGFANRLEINGKKIMEKEQIPTNYTLQLKEFLTAIREKRTPLASGKEIRNVVKVMDAVNSSIKTGKVVPID